MNKDKLKLKAEINELEYLAEIEMEESHKSHNIDERNKHVINAIIAESSATYLHNCYGGTK